MTRATLPFNSLLGGNQGGDSLENTGKTGKKVSPTGLQITKGHPSRGGT